MPFKFAFIGQDIPMHLPFLLVDFLYAGKEDGILAVEEKNAAMRDVLQHYAEAIVYASGRKAQVIVSGNRQEVLMGADCVVYAGDCMAAGAHVTHVDAAKGMIQWGKENRELSKLPEERSRWIVEDALRFVQREIRRGNTYDGILMDPPSYGRGPSGEVWKLENELFGLVDTSAKVLSDKPLFFLINSYTTGFQASVLSNMLMKCVSSRHGGIIDAQELCLPVTTGGVLPCGASGRWSAE